MNKRRIKETKGLAQGHTGRKRQPQDRNSSSSSPESKFSARGALLCTCVCTEAGASADDSELSWNPPAHTNHCHLRVKPISQNYSHRQRKVERFSPTDESDEGSPNQASVWAERDTLFISLPTLYIDAWPELALIKFTEWLLFQATENGGSGIEFMSQTAWVQILAWSLNSFTPLSLFPHL